MKRLCASLLALFVHSALAAETMTWVLPDFAPVSIIEDGKPGNGITNELMLLLMTHWPNVEHRFITANTKRTWVMLEGKEEVCHASALVSDERLKIAYFSLTHLVPPPQLIIQADVLASYPRNAAGEVILSRLLASAKRGALLEKRSYGASIDATIASRPDSSGLKLVTPSDYGTQTLKKLQLDRLDYTIEYDFVLAYQQSLDSSLKSLLSVPIAGNTAPVTAGVACPRSPWGQAAIRKIDAILSKHADSLHLRGALERWLTPETRKRYDAAMTRFYRQRATPTDAKEFD